MYLFECPLILLPHSQDIAVAAVAVVDKPVVVVRNFLFVNQLAHLLVLPINHS